MLASTTWHLPISFALVSILWDELRPPALAIAAGADRDKDAWGQLKAKEAIFTAVNGTQCQCVP